MKKPWQYIVNQFLKASNKSIVKAFKLSNYHDAYLHRMMLDNPSDADYALLYNRYHPVHQDLVQHYTAWKNAGGKQKGQTLNLDQLLELLPRKVNKWDALIQSETGFEKETAHYLSIFPQGRAPFGTGGKAERVEAVNVLAENLSAYPALATVKALVLAHYTLLEDAYELQEGAKGGKKQKSHELDQSRKAAMTEQYRNLGFLINKAADRPQIIEPFFDLGLLRESRQSVFTGSIDPNKKEAILIHTFAADDELQLRVASESGAMDGTMLRFYLGSTANGTDSTAVEVEANAAPTVITLAAFGISDYGIHRYLSAQNPNAMELRYVIEMM